MAKAKKAAAAAPKMRLVQVLRPFRHTTGEVVQPGSKVEVDEERHKALARNGLVEPPAGPVGHAVKARVPGALTHGSFQPRRRSLTGGE